MLTRGWYQDPNDPERARWHDGTRMTEHTLVIAEQPPGRTPPPPSDDLLSWSPDDLPLERGAVAAPLSADLDRAGELDLALDLGRPVDEPGEDALRDDAVGETGYRRLAEFEELDEFEELRRGSLADLDPGDDTDAGVPDEVRAPRHRVRDDAEIASFWDASRIRIPAPRGSWVNVALPLVGIAIVVVAVLSMQLRGDDAEDRVQATSTDSPSVLDEVTTTTVDRSPAVSLPTTESTVSAAPPTSSSSSTTSTTARRSAPPTKAPAVTEPTTTTAAPVTSSTTTTTTPTVTPGDTCSTQGATARIAGGGEVSCEPACGAGPNDLVWRALDC